MKDPLTIGSDGSISFDLQMAPEVYAMLVKYKHVKFTEDISVNDTINNILRDFLIERLARPSNFKSLKPLDAFDLEKGK